MSKKTSYYLLSFLLIGIVIFLYFFKWRTQTIYGDDLLIYQYHSGLKSFFDKINISVSLSAKYRPIACTTLHLMLVFFQKNIFACFLFNVTIQIANAMLFLMILNMFFENKWIALIFSLIFAISRFSYYNISQLYNGGTTEGLAMTFFLLTLSFIIKIFIQTESTSTQKQKWLLWCILFANLCLYTHERYIVLFPFLLLILFFYKGFRTTQYVHKIYFSLLCIASVALNVAIKKYFFSIPFFMGTGNKNIDFSLLSAITYFKDCVLSIFIINSGPEYLVGMPFGLLPMVDKISVLTLTSAILIVFIIFLRKAINASILLFFSKIIEPAALIRKPNMPKYSALFLFLSVLFVFLLVPAVVTIRVEQRWLEASFSIFIIMIVIAFLNMNYTNNIVKHSSIVIFVIFFIAIDHNYLKKGIDNLYMRDAEKSAMVFKNAVNDGTIRSGTSTLYFRVKHRDQNAEDGFIWSIRDGYLFDYYQGKGKRIIFVDSVYERSHSVTDTTLAHFNKNSDQLIYTKGPVIDITAEYLRDSLKTFKDE